MNTTSPPLKISIMLLNFTPRHIHRHIWWEWRQELESAFLVTVGPWRCFPLMSERSPFGNIKYSKLYRILNQNIHHQTSSRVRRQSNFPSTLACIWEVEGKVFKFSYLFLNISNPLEINFKKFLWVGFSSFVPVTGKGSPCLYLNPWAFSHIFPPCPVGGKVGNSWVVICWVVWLNLIWFYS